jgi:hypothetical protein
MCTAPRQGSNSGSLPGAQIETINSAWTPTFQPYFSTSPSSQSLCSPEMRHQSIQEKFAKNLSPSPHGTAIYHPLVMRQRSGRVGDIAFHDFEGKYKWIRNAFDSDVLCPPCALLILRDYLNGTGMVTELLKWTR